MKIGNKFSNVTKTFKSIMFALLVYAVLIVATFFYAGMFMVKLWLLPAALVVFTIMSAYSAYEDHNMFQGYVEAFNNRLVALVTWYIEVGVQ